MASSRVASEYLRHFWQYVGDSNEVNVLKTAFYTVGAQIVVLIVCSALLALFYTMQLFIKPLMWAFLCGCALHSLKYECSKLVRDWLVQGRKSQTGITSLFAFLPIQLLKYGLNALDFFLFRYWALVLGTLTLLFVVLLCEVQWETVAAFVSTLEGLLGEMAMAFFNATEKLKYVYVWTLTLAYLLLLVFWWNPQSSRHFRLMAVPVWFTLWIWASSFINSIHMRLAAALSLPVLIAISQIASSMWPQHRKKSDALTDGANKEKEYAGHRSRRSARHFRRLSVKVSFYLSGGGEDCDEVDGKDGMNLSRFFFLALFWAIAVVKLWQNVWLLFVFVPVCLSTAIVYRLLLRFGVWETIGTWTRAWGKTVSDWTEARKEAVLPGSVQGVFRLLRRIEEKLCLLLESAVDSLSSLFVIGSLIFGIATLSLLIGIQTQGEAVHIATVTNGLWNYTLNQSPEIHQWLNRELEKSGMQSAFDSAVQHSFEFGRKWIVDQVRQFSSDQDFNTSQLEQQLLAGYDQIYRTWTTKESNTSRIEGISSLYSNLSGFRFSDLKSFVLQNLGALSSIVQSFGSFLSQNLNLMFSFITAVFSLIFRSGSAFFNLVISILVFFSALFYLLAMSGKEYSPLAYLIALVPLESESTRNTLQNAVSEAIRSVFGASLKMALFYGLFTWLTHTLFGMNVVIIPAAIAALFGAVPFVGTYWVAVPGSVALWLFDQEVKAIGLIAVHILPTYIVDGAIYGEIEGGGHPYVTGLAVAGGLYWFGLEGAIIGPLLLCGLLVAIDVYRSIIVAGTRDESLAENAKRLPAFSRSLSQQEPSTLNWPPSSK